MSAHRSPLDLRLRWAEVPGSEFEASWLDASATALQGILPMPTRCANLPVSAWPLSWQTMHRPAWVRSVWARLQFALQHPVDTVETPTRRAHVALGLMRFSESSDGRLDFARWRRTYKGVVWMPPQSSAEALIEFEDLPNGHVWQADLYAACAFEIHEAERSAGRIPNSGYIHAYVYRCVAPMLRALRQQPEWRTLGRRIQDGLQVDRISLARARRMLRFDRGSSPCTIDLYNLSVANRHLFDRAEPHRVSRRPVGLSQTGLA